jgi:methionine sulfoxide reductase heme-binding subunit
VTNKRIVWLKIFTWLVCLSTLLQIIYKAATNNMGPNPVEFVQLSTGSWALILLMASLAITPLRKIANMPWLIRFRRLLGLFAFFYVCLHFTTYLVFDQQFDLRSIWKDVYKRPFITMGFLAFVLLIPVALTSTTGWIRRLGGKRWNRLHKLVYVAAIAAAIHFWWKVKADHREPGIYAAVLAVLLGWRVWEWMAKRQLLQVKTS